MILVLLKTCATIHITTATLNKAVKKILNCLAYLFVVLLLEILFGKFLYKFMNLVYTHLFQLMPWNPIEKAPDGYRQAVGKRGEQTRSGAAKTKFATCQHFSLLGFLHPIVSSQNAAVMLKWIFMKTKLTATRQL